jgi:fibronectin-binding autotransporter adhesin
MKLRRSFRLALGLPNRRTTTLGAVALATGALLSPASAATQTLNVSGNWDTTSPIWDGATTWTNGNDAVFGGSASAIEIAGDIQVSGISSANDVAFNNTVPGGTLTFVSPATLSGGGDLTFNVVLAGSAGLTINNAGAVVTLNADNSLTGAVAVNNGSLVLGSASALNAIGSLSIAAPGSVATNAVNQLGFVTVTNAGTLTLGANDTVQAYVSNGGVFNGAGTLTAATYALNDNSTVNGNLGNGVITANGSVALAGNTGSTGALAVQSGTTTVSGNLGATVVSVANAATLATSGAGNLANTAALTLTGTGTLQLGSSDTIGNLSGAGQVDLGTHTLTFANGAAANSSATISGTGGLTLLAGTQTLSGANAYTGATNVNGGTLALTGSLDSTVVNVASGAALSSTGGLADATQLSLNVTGTATFTGAETLAGLTGGTGAVNATGTDLTVTGTLETSGNISVRDLAVGTLNGASTITSSGVVTASAGNFGGNIATGSLVKDTGGTLTLTAPQSFTGGTNVTGGTLVLGHATNTLADTGALTLQAGAAVELAGTDTVATFTANGGTLAGAGTLTAATYDLNNGAVIEANLGTGTITANGTVALEGDSAAATLNVQSGVTTLSGASSATDVNVTGGSLDLAPAGTLASVATLDISGGATVLTSANEQLSDTVAVTNNGTLSVGGAETVGTLQNAGTISGSGTLTTAVYSLNAGSNITGNLGEGILNVTGNTGISGTAAADTVNVTAGTLSLTGNNLDDSAAVTNSAGATISLTGSDTVGTLVNSGTISGAGTLTAATYQLNAGSVISGNLGAGTVDILGATNISGTVAAETVNVADGITLTLDGDNLADTATLDLGTGATITLLGSDTVGTFINNAGFLAGFGTLNASDYILNDGTVIDANLGAGNITTNGTVAINGITGTGVFTVASGQTTLATFTGANTVNIAPDADLVLTADAEINVATTVSIGTGASLTTGGVNQIGNATLTNAGTLTLGGNDAIAAYVSDAGTLEGPGTLTAATYALNDNSTVNGNLGNGDITANGIVAINGTTGAGILTVASGETTLNNTSAATTVAVTGGLLDLTAAASLNSATAITVSDGGTLALGASDQLADAAALVNDGTLALDTHSDTVATYAGGGALTGTGTLTAATYALNDGAVIDANLGNGDITANGEVDINGTTGTGALLVESGETTLANTSGATTVELTGGALTLTAGGSLQSAATITLAGGTTLATGADEQLADTAAVTSAGAINLGGDETILSLAGSGTVDLGEHTLTLADGSGADTSAAISGTGGLTLTTGTQTLSGASTYTGATNVNGGTLALTGSLASTTVNVADGALLTSNGGLAAATDLTLVGTGAATFTGDETLATLTADTGTVDATGAELTVTGALASDGILLVDNLTAGSVSGALDVTATGDVTATTLDGTTAASLDVAGLITASDGTYDGVILDGALEKISAGTLTLTGANTSTDAITVTAGTLVLTGTTASTSLDVATTATLQLGSAGRLLGTDATLTNAGTVTLGGDENLGAAGAFISDGGLLAGTGTLTAATYALNDGTVIDANLGAGDITANGEVEINGTTGAGALLVESGETTLNNTSGATTAELTGGALTLTADGSLQSVATITLAAATTLTTAADEQLADTAAVTSAGAINLGGDETILSLAGSGTVALGEHTLTLANGSGASSAAVISGTGGLTLTTGTQTLSGASTYTGDTVVNGGNLIIDGSNQSAALLVNAGLLNLNATSNAATVNIAAGATVTTGSAERLNNNVVIANDGALNIGGNETLGALSGTGTVNLGTSNLTFAGDGDANPGELISDFSGIISGSGTLTKNGDDIQILSGDNDYSGIAFINDGILRVTHADALGVAGANGRTNVNPGGTLQIANNIVLTESIRISGAGFNDLGSINNLSGTNTLTGQIGVVGGQPDTIVSATAGTLNITGDVLRSVYIVGDAVAPVPRLTFDTAQDATIALVGSNFLFHLSNIGDIAKTGSGTLDLVNLVGNQSTGNLLLEDGTVRIGLESRLGGSQVVFGASDTGILRIASTATQTAIAPAGGQLATGGDGTYADFRNTVFNFASGDGTLFTDADTAVRLSNLTNFADARIIKDGAANLLLDLVGGGDAKILPSLVVNSGSVFFLAEDTASLTLAGLGEGGSGGGTVAFGALDLVIDQDFSSTFTGNLDGTGDLTINTTDSADLVISGVLSNFASVSVGGDGTGSLELSGDSTYVGPTNILAGGNLGLSGTLQTASVDIAADGELALLGSERLLDTATLSNSGTLELGANDETVATYVSTGGVLDGTGTLSAATYALNDGTIINANLGDGDVTANGTVVLNGSTGSGVFTVQTGGTLRGVGANIGGDLVIDVGATLAPGSSPGVTVVGGNWIHNGVYEAELAGLGGAGVANGHDQVQVAGSITLDNGTPGDLADDTATLSIRRDNTFGFSEAALGDTFRIISGDLADQMFATVTTEFSTGLVLDLADGTLIGTGLAGTGPSGRVDLTTLPGLDANTRAIVAALQDAAFAADNTGGAVRDNGVQFNSGAANGTVEGAAVRALLTSPLGAGNNLNQISPESYAGEPAYAIRATRHYADTALAAAPVATAGDFSIFTAYSAHNAGTTGSVNAADYDLSGSGALLGGRLHLGEKAAVGIFAAFDSGEIDSTHRNADIDGTVFGVFAETALGERWKLDAAVTLGDYESDSRRTSLVGPDAVADGVGTQAFGFSVGLSYDLVKEAKRGLMPYVEFNYASAESDAFVETGPADALAVDSIEHTSLRGELGARGYIMVNERFSFTGQLGVSQEFGDDDTDVGARLASGGTPFTVVSPGFGDTALTAGVGASYALTKSLSVGAGAKIGMDSDSDTATSFHVSGGMRF